MEGFLRPATAVSYPLSAFDMQGSFSNIPYAFFFENHDGSRDDFMPTDLVKKSLARALEDFPILIGHIRAQATGKLVVEVSPDQLNIPDFLETACTDTSFGDIKAAKFAWSSWPEGVATVGPFATPSVADGEIRLLTIHLVRLKDESGVILFVNIPHYAVDGAGYFAFIKHWASTMASMVQKRTADEGASRLGQHSKEPLVIDRGCIPKYLPTNDRKPLDEISKAMYTASNFFCDTLAWFSPTTLGNLLARLGRLSPPGEAHLFHLSQKTLNSLKDAAQQHIHSDSSRITTNDILVALIGKTYVQSQPPAPAPKAGWFRAAPPAETHFTFRIPCDARPRLGVLEKFTGNLLIPMLVREPLEQLAQPTNPLTLASAAQTVRGVIGSVNSGLIAEYHDTIAAHPTSHMRPLSFAASHQTTSMVTTSQVRFGLYDADFGYGRPRFVCLSDRFAGSYTMAAFLPTPPPEEGEEGGGVNVLLTSNTLAMKGILANEFWRQAAELVW